MADEEAGVVDGVGCAWDVIIQNGDRHTLVLTESGSQRIAQGESEALRDFDVDIIDDAQRELFSRFAGSKAELTDRDMMVALSGSGIGGPARRCGAHLKLASVVSLVEYLTVAGAEMSPLRVTVIVTVPTPSSAL
ncbi:MAG TPA: hypothetical protein VF544_25240 [Pyrinomonadaceae bacterium]